MGQDAPLLLKQGQPIDGMLKLNAYLAADFPDRFPGHGYPLAAVKADMPG